MWTTTTGCRLTCPDHPRCALIKVRASLICWQKRAILPERGRLSWHHHRGPPAGQGLATIYPGRNSHSLSLPVRFWLTPDLIALLVDSAPKAAGFGAPGLLIPSGDNRACSLKGSNIFVCLSRQPWVVTCCRFPPRHTSEFRLLPVRSRIAKDGLVITTSNRPAHG
jgi:hypothetical protein